MTSAQARSERDQPSIAVLPAAELAVLEALCAWAAVVNFWIFRHFVWDDAYITYRYAQNLAEGHGFVFNPGDRLLGTTSPLYALLLAAFGRLGAPIDLASAALFSFFLSAAALQGALLLRRQGSPILALGFIVLVVGGLGNVLHFFGMETSLLLWLLAAAIAAAERERPLLLGVLLGLSVLCRYDAAPAAIAIAALALERWRRGGSLRARLAPAVRAAAAFLVVVAPWLVFAQLYFGSILPTTLAAKAGDASFHSYLDRSLRLQLEGLHPLRRLGLDPAAGALVGWVWLALLLAPLPLAASRVLRLPARALLFTFPPVLWIVYAWIGPPVQHRWHLIPASFVLTLVAALAWGALVRRSPGAVTRALALIAATVFAAMLPAAVKKEHRELVDTGFYRGRAVAYREMADWITRSQLSDLPVATIEPGYLCYLSRNPAIDFAGLVTRGLYFHGPEERRTSMSDLIDRVQPPFLVTSFGHPAGMSAPDYVTVWDAFPSRQLLMREGAFAARFDRLLHDWRSAPPRAEAVGHPFRFEAALATDASAIPWLGGETPPLRLDFDEIAFRFESTHADLAVAQLVVEGQVVFQSSADQRSRRARPGADPVLGPLELIWPVRPWRGRSAVLRVIDVAPAPHSAAAGDIRSLRDAAPARRVDDFEAERFGSTWEDVFSGGPFPLRDLARDRGLAFALGDRAALSLGRPGRQALRSRPLRLDSGQLSMVIFDLGEATTVSLEVDGKRHRAWRGRGSGRLVPITWDVSRWRGASAVLEVRDNDPAPERGIGVDEIVMFDRAE